MGVSRIKLIKKLFKCGPAVFFKGTHTVYFISSFYIINENPVIPRTDFYCITTWVAHSSG